MLLAYGVLDCICKFCKSESIHMPDYNLITA